MAENNLVGIVEKTLQRCVSRLSEEDVILLQLREELYVGSWDKMKQDLDDRLKSRPYIHKIAQRIEKDLERIDRLKDLEARYNFSFLTYLPAILKVKA